MITFFLMGLLGLAILFVGAPVVLYGLMLETVRERAALAAPATPSQRALRMSDREPPSRRLSTVAA